MTQNKPIYCAQGCGRLAIVAVGGNPGHPLCVEHYSMWQEANARQSEGLERAINMLEGHMYDVVGLQRPTPSFPPRPAPVVVRSQIDRSIHIDRSVVGSVNSGTINTLEVSMSHINSSNPELARAIKTFTESVGSEKSWDQGQKQEILDLLAVISGEVEKPKEVRRKSIIKTLMSGIQSAVVGAANVGGAWALVEKLIGMML